MDSLGRRALLAAPLIAAVPRWGAAAADKPIRIGVLNDQSGVFSEGTGPGATLAARMAAADFGGRTAGRPVEVIAADHQNKPDIGASIARSWIDEGGVDAIADLGNTAVALAVVDIVRQKNKAALISAGGSPVLTGASCSPNTVMWTYDTYSNANTLARALVQRGADTWFFITVDYAYGRSLQEEATRVLDKAGAKVLGGVVHPLNNADFSSYLLQAKVSGAKVVALANGGDDVARALKQAREFGVTPAQTIAGLSAIITDIHAAGLEVAQGLLLSESFYWNLNDGTRDFSRRWSAQRGGSEPTMLQAGVYGAVTHYLKAVQAVGGPEDGLRVVDAMKAAPTDDPLFGRGTVRADGRTIHDNYVFRVKSPAESRSPWDCYEVFATIPGDQAFRPMAEGGCPLVSGRS